MYDAETWKAVSGDPPSGTGEQWSGENADSMFTLHPTVTRTLYVQDDWPEFLRLLWREQHPDGHEQGALDFAVTAPKARNVLLSKDMDEVRQPGGRDGVNGVKWVPWWTGRRSRPTGLWWSLP